MLRLLASALVVFSLTAPPAGAEMINKHAIYTMKKDMFICATKADLINMLDALLWSDPPKANLAAAMFDADRCASPPFELRVKVIGPKSALEMAGMPSTVKVRLVDHDDGGWIHTKFLKRAK
jgi:hypothetical protein